MKIAKIEEKINQGRSITFEQRDRLWKAKYKELKVVTRKEYFEEDEEGNIIGKTFKQYFWQPIGFCGLGRTVGLPMYVQELWGD